MQRADVHVIQSRDGPRLAMKAVGELRQADLDRHLPAQSGIERAVHDTHASRVETLFDTIGPDHGGCRDGGLCERAQVGLNVRQEFAVSQKALDLQLQRLVASARFGDIGRPAGVQAARGVKDLLKTLPALRGHHGLHLNKARFRARSAHPR